MQISGLKYQIAAPQTSPPANAGKDFESSATTNSTPASPSGGSGTRRFAPGARAPLEAALASGMVNSADWLAKSDVDLVRQTTGAIIKDGKVYDKNGADIYRDGNDAEAKAVSDLIDTLFELRNYGVPVGDRMVAEPGAITAGDLEKYIEHYAAGATGPGDVAKLDTDVVYDAISRLTPKI